MAARYVHVRDLHLQERVLRDRETDHEAHAATFGGDDPLDALVTELERLLSDIENDASEVSECPA
jgi:hypothetical protein